MRYMLDTNICIYMIRKRSPHALSRLTACVPGSVAVSSITVAELQFGVSKSQYPAQNQQALDMFLIPLQIADFDYQAASAYGQIRAALESLGQPIGALDMLIAAHALSLDALLITNNVFEFSRVPGLALEDWTK